jgi:1-deoxy-D-xylulose-5-phosphate reductoisomerase
MKTLAILGSTGSIGTNTLDVVRQNRHSYQVYSMAAGRNSRLLARQVLEFRPRLIVTADPEGVLAELSLLGVDGTDCPEIASGPEALVEAAVAPEIDIVVSAIVGVAGLEATYRSIQAGKRVGLANKEVLVAGGSLVMDALRHSGAELLPIDSEHNGAHQCFRAGRRAEVSKLILTASGGPFRATPQAALASVTPEQALDHPTWRMGSRITIDSATLMNKGFEVIEACWLFDLTPDEIEVVIHPQSCVHALVEYADGSVLAQISTADMRMPIQYALTYPERTQAPVSKIDWRQIRQWDFHPPDFERFPLLRLAYECQRTGGSATCTLNAADEIAVQSFLDGKIGFLGIAGIVEETLERMPVRQPASIADLLEIDKESRALARRLVAERSPAAVH